MTIRQKAKLNLYTSINVQDYLLTVFITWTKYCLSVNSFVDFFKCTFNETSILNINVGFKLKV
jgi:hypothetical protein